MPQFNDTELTAAVIKSFEETPDPRVKFLMEELVKSLHEYVRKTDLTFDEWTYAIDVLTRTGQKCTSSRQEFILLSDVLGVSMLVDAVNHREREGATETTVLGPFYVANPPVLPDGTDIAHGNEGPPLYVTGSVTSPYGDPLVGAAVDVWHSDEHGFYDVQKPGGETQLRARFITDAQGRFAFWTIVPRYYPVPHDGPVGAMLKATKRHPYRPAHLHFMIAHPGFETLVTHLFMDGDPYLDSDAVFGVKQSLIVRLTEESGPAPGRQLEGPWHSLDHRFGLKPAGAVP